MAVIKRRAGIEDKRDAPRQQALLRHRPLHRYLHRAVAAKQASEIVLQSVEKLLAAPCKPKDLHTLVEKVHTARKALVCGLACPLAACTRPRRGVRYKKDITADLKWAAGGGWRELQARKIRFLKWWQGQSRNVHGSLHSLKTIANSWSRA